MLKIRNQKRDPFVPHISMSALFRLSSFGHWNNIVANQKEINFTRRELKHDITLLAKAFLNLGIKKGDIILVTTGRSIYDNIIIFFAANRIGAVASFLDEKTPRDTILHYLEDFKSPLLFTYHKSPSQIKAFKKDVKTLKNVINLTSDFNEKTGKTQF